MIYKFTPEDRFKLLDIACIMQCGALSLELEGKRNNPRYIDTITAYRQYAKWLREKVKESDAQ